MELNMVSQRPAPPPPCPTCNRPMYQDVEHNPLCGAIQNLQALVMKSAGVLEEDQAARWAELHESMTKQRLDMPEAMQTQLDTHHERLSRLEHSFDELRKRVAQPAENSAEKKDPPADSGASKIITE
jgi:hypothetical protein